MLTLIQGNPATIVLEKEYVFVVGQISEDFETGDFTQHAWNHGGNANWIITQSEPFEGLYCARSGQISDNQKSNLSIDYEVIGNDSIRFCYRVSSESSYDFLRFYIDNIKVAEWSGESAWARAAYPVGAGSHTFKWAYEKDGSVIGGQDAAWIDEIIFPPVDINTGTGDDKNFIPGLIVYPNPASGFINIVAGTNTGQNLDLTITDLAGKAVYSMNGLTETAIINVEVTGIKPGLYFIRLNNNKFSETIKLIIK
jgi:hypothetical protein